MKPPNEMNGGSKWEVDELIVYKLMSWELGVDVNDNVSINN